jgi:ProP effector
MKSMNTMSPAAASNEANENADNGTPNQTGTPASQSTAEPATESPVESAPSEPAAAGASADEAAEAPSAATAPSAQPAHSADTQSPRALLKQLQQQFKAFRDCLPLAIGIDKQVLARMPGLNRKTMRAALGIHTGSMRYLRAMEKATVRYDLDGNAGAEVTDTHRQHAKELLQERFKKEAERKKAERELAAKEEADRKHQEKLTQLASKFSRR